MSELPKKVEESYDDYWSNRTHMMYYNYIDILVRALAKDSNSLIDIGSADAQYIENFDWITKRTTLDIYKPYTSKNVEGIEIDFLKYNPSEKYDFATCLQVLEHIPDAKKFAQKLFEIADNVLISVPYLWEAGSCVGHIHDPVDLAKVVEWTGREPDYHIIVKEPLFNSPKSNRLICYYHKAGKKFNVKSARKVLKSLTVNNLGAIHEGTNNETIAIELEEKLSNIEHLTNKNNSTKISKLNHIENKLDALEEKLEKSNINIQKIIEEQLIKHSNKVKENELKILQEELKKLRLNNSKSTETLEKLDAELYELKLKYNKVMIECNNYKQKYFGIKNSRSWRFTLPLRKIKKLISRMYR